jgi:hypothetical protein
MLSGQQVDFLHNNDYVVHRVAELLSKFRNLRGVTFLDTYGSWGVTLQELHEGVRKEDVVRAIAGLRNQVSTLRGGLQQSIYGIRQIQGESHGGNLLDLEAAVRDCDAALELLNGLEGRFSAYEEQLGMAVQSCKDRRFGTTLDCFTRASMSLNEMNARLHDLEKRLSKPLYARIKKDLSVPIRGNFARAA